MRWRKLTLNQAGLPAATKDEFKKIVIYHVTTENAAVCVTKVSHVNALSIKTIKETKEMKKPKKVTADVSDSICQEFGIVIPIASHKYPSVEWLHACLSGINLFRTFKDLIWSLMSLIRSTG